MILTLKIFILVTIIFMHTQVHITLSKNIYNLAHNQLYSLKLIFYEKHIIANQPCRKYNYLFYLIQCHVTVCPFAIYIGAGRSFYFQQKASLPQKILVVAFIFGLYRCCPSAGMHMPFIFLNLYLNFKRLIISYKIFFFNINTASLAS